MLAMPNSLSFNYSYRSSLRVWYRCQVLTRITLALHYVGSFRRLIIYTRDVEYGLLFRYIHANGASFFLGFVFLHVGRGLYYGSSDKIFLWISRIIMRVAFMRVAFLRYVLPYGQMSYWGATVIINLLSVVSYQVCILLWGRFVVSEYTVTRFYVLHFLIPLALAILVLRHLHLLHVTRRSSLSYSPQKISFFPFLMMKDVLVWSFYFICFVVLVCVYSNSLRDAENFIHANPMVTPIHIKPEWYFLFAYAILRCIPDKTTRVLALAASVVLPVCRILRKRQSGLSSMRFFVYVFIWLTVFRRMPIILNYYFRSQVLSILYFVYILIFL
jgi:ubiquinol-cytochrome c reductase cytochrome b subunit